MNDLKEFIERNCFTSKGGLNNRVTLKSWWDNKGYEKEYHAICEYSFSIPGDFSQKIYHAYHGHLQVGLCEVCKKQCAFLGFSKGYRNCCSIECSSISPTRIEKIKNSSDYDALSVKVKENNLKKYGVHTPLLVPEIQEKMRKNKIDKWGSLHANPEKIKQTNLERYGVETLLKDREFQDRIRSIKNEKYDNGLKNYKGNSSSIEKELIEFLNSETGFQFKTNRSALSGLEIDAYCKEIKFGIELCGLYWHSERFKDNNYHFKKYQAATDAGIRLLTIYEDEWNNRNSQVKGFILSTLGIFENRIFARNCKFLPVAKKSANQFFDDNHIQGSPNSISHAYGLYYNDDLVACVSFSKHHRGSENIVLNRLAFQQGFQVLGGASKLVKNAFIDIGQPFITWSDNRWSVGNVYQESGFVFDGNLRHDYEYVKNGVRLSKQSCTKKKWNIPQNITEHEYFKSINIMRIYDCGKKRWKYNG